MKRPSFLHGATLALGLALLSAFGASLLPLVLTNGAATQSLLTGLSGLYTLYLLAMSKASSGRVSVACGWVVWTAALSFVAPSLSQAFCAQLLWLWLVRCGFYHEHSLGVLADFAIYLLGAAAAVLTAWHTASIFLTVWVFFLCQATFVAIPEFIPRNRTRTNPQQRFDTALRRAQQSVHRFHSKRG